MICKIGWWKGKQEELRQGFQVPRFPQKPGEHVEKLIVVTFDKTVQADEYVVYGPGFWRRGVTLGDIKPLTPNRFHCGETLKFTMTLSVTY